MSYALLLEVMDLVAVHTRLDTLFPDLARSLQKLVDFDTLGIVLPRRGGEAADIFRVPVGPGGESDPVAVVESIAIPPLHQTRLASLWAARDPVVLHDLEGADYPEIVSDLRARGKRSACLLPLMTPIRPVGILGFASERAGAYDEADLEFLERVASQVALTIDNVRHHEEALANQRQLEGERDHWRTLLEINNAVVTNLDLKSVLAAITPSLRRVVPHDYTSLALISEDKRHVGQLALDPDLPSWVEEVALSVVPGDHPVSLALALRKPVEIDREQLPKYLPPSIRARAEGIEAHRVCVAPLFTQRRGLGAMWLVRRAPEPFGEDERERLAQAAGQIAIALENALAFREIAELKERLARENVYVADEIKGTQHIGEIVGESKALQRVLAQARSVAPTDSTVLLLGETGTGKEVIARAVHSLSERRARPLVTVNCATSPAGLLESEWFGHEKGAFTGALAQKVGRFELAQQGTLFLDEIGDVPFDLQPKLLRALQEREIERLGSTRTIRVDFRLIAATNRNLAEMVAAREYRADLYYRLNVFPIRIPPLRERPEDIPPLVRYFVQRYAKKHRKPIDAVPRETMEALCRWPWPGNVRELQNVIERAVILSQGPTLRVPRSELEIRDAVPTPARTLEEVEREHILRVLDETGWVIGGSAGAATRLGLKRTTLVSMMRRLGITRPGARR